MAFLFNASRIISETILTNVYFYLLRARVCLGRGLACISSRSSRCTKSPLGFRFCMLTIKWLSEMSHWEYKLTMVGRYLTVVAVLDWIYQKNGGWRNSYSRQMIFNSIKNILFPAPSGGDTKCGESYLLATMWPASFIFRLFQSLD